MVSQKSAQLQADDCAIEGNRLSGVISLHEGSLVHMRGGSVRGNNVGVYAALGGVVRLSLSVALDGNHEADQGCVDKGRVEREAKPQDIVLARPLSAKMSHRR